MTHMSDSHHTEASKDLHTSKLAEYIWGQNFEAMEDVEHNLSFFLLHGAHHDLQCQFHSQIYILVLYYFYICFYFCFIFFCYTWTCLDIIFRGFSVLLQTPKQSSRKAMLPLSGRVLHIQVDGMIKVDQSGIRLTHEFCVGCSVQDGNGNDSHFSPCRSIFFQRWTSLGGQSAPKMPGFPSAKMETEDGCVTCFSPSQEPDVVAVVVVVVVEIKLRFGPCKKPLQFCDDVLPNSINGCFIRHKTLVWATPT